MTLTWVELINYYNRIPDNEIAFFASIDDLAEIGPSVSGMMNAYGGYIFIGVDFGNFHLLGSSLTEEELNDYVGSQFKNMPTLEFDVITRNERQICMITIPESETKPQLFKGQCYIRSEGKTRRASIEEESKMRNDSQSSKGLVESIAMNKKKEPVIVQLTEIETEKTPVTEDLSEEVSEERAENDSPVYSSIENTMPVLEKKIDDGDYDSLAMDDAEEEKTLVLNKRQKKTLRFLKRHKSIRNKKYRSLFEVSHKTAHLELIELKEAGYIAVEGQGRSTRYLPVDLSPVETKRRAPRAPKESSTEPAQEVELKNDVTELGSEQETESAVLEMESRSRIEDDFSAFDPSPESLKEEKEMVDAEIEINVENGEFENSLLEIRSLIGEVENSAHSNLEAPAYQDSEMVRKNFLIAYLKHNTRLSCEQYAQLLRISQEQAMKDLKSLEQSGELSKFVYRGAIHYQLCEKEAARLESMAQLLAS